MYLKYKIELPPFTTNILSYIKTSGIDTRTKMEEQSGRLSQCLIPQKRIEGIVEIINSSQVWHVEFVTAATTFRSICIIAELN